MAEPEQGMSWVEYLESKMPAGNKCNGCGHIVFGKCSIWGQDVGGKSIKCKWCRKNKWLEHVRKDKKLMGEED